MELGRLALPSNLASAASARAPPNLGLGQRGPCRHIHAQQALLQRPGQSRTPATVLALAGCAALRGRRRVHGQGVVVKCSQTEAEGVADVAAGGSSSSGSGPGAVSEDRLVRYLGGNVSVRAIEATNMVREACLRHKASPMVSLALGRALLGTTLLANGRDPGETLQLRILGSGPCGVIIAEATAAMQCRGFVGEPQADARTVPELIGMSEDATLRITRTHPYWKRPYTGTIQLKNGEIAEDIVQYLAMSEQTPASMGLSIEWDHEAGHVKHAEGWLVTLLPDWEESEVAVLEANINSFSSMEQGDLPRPEAICEHLLRELLGRCQATESPCWQCRCTPKRLLTAVMMLGKTEVLKMLREKEEVEAKCEWCGGTLTVTPEQIREHMKSDQGSMEVATRTATPRQLKLKEDELQEVPAEGTADWS